MKKAISLLLTIVMITALLFGCDAKKTQLSIYFRNAQSNELSEEKRSVKADEKAGAVELAKRICTQREGSVLADQFNNPVNPLAHYQSTAPEMARQMQAMRQKIDIFVCCIGTGGTVSGVGKYIKERYEGAQVIGVEPAASPLISKGYAGAHAIQGIGANFIPKTLDRSVLDGVECVSDNEAYDFTKLLKEQENLLCGISSGAALCAAVRLAKREENAGKNIVTVFPDDGGRYFSTGVFD